MNKSAYRILLIFLILNSLIATFDNLYAQKIIIGVADVPLFKRPKDEAKTVWVLHKGDTIEIIKKNPDWLKISYKSIKGYVSADILYTCTLPGSKNDSIISSKIENHINLVSPKDQNAALNDTSLNTGSFADENIEKYSTDTSSIKKESTENQNAIVSDTLHQLDSNSRIETNPALVKEPNGFIEGFAQGIVYSIFIVPVILFFLTAKKVKDGRFSSGYRSIQRTGTEVFTLLFFSGLICIIIGLFSGTYYWIKEFF